MTLCFFDPLCETVGSPRQPTQSLAILHAYFVHHSTRVVTRRKRADTWIDTHHSSCAPGLVIARGCTSRRDGVDQTGYQQEIFPGPGFQDLKFTFNPWNSLRCFHSWNERKCSFLVTKVPGVYFDRLRLVLFASVFELESLSFQCPLGL